MLLDIERGCDIKIKVYNACFYGNPGTGKTTVARLYADLLTELGVLPKASMVEIGGAVLAEGGIPGLKALLAQLYNGGVLFIDEASNGLLSLLSSPLGYLKIHVMCTCNWQETSRTLYSEIGKTRPSWKVISLKTLYGFLPCRQDVCLFCYSSTTRMT